MRSRYALCLLAVLAMLGLHAEPGRASPPSPANWTTPACISLVGGQGGVPATAFGQFDVVARDLANNPMAGVAVVVDLSRCHDLQICADQLDPNAIVNCAAKTVRKLTDANGRVTFTVLGGGNGQPASTLLGGGQILGDGVLEQTPTISTFDLDGSGGVGANDLSAWLGDFGSGNPYGRSDYDCSGGIGANDLSLWLNAWGSGTMATSCGASCP